MDQKLEKKLNMVMKYLLLKNIMKTNQISMIKIKPLVRRLGKKLM